MSMVTIYNVSLLPPLQGPPSLLITAPQPLCPIQVEKVFSNLIYTIGWWTAGTSTIHRPQSILHQTSK